MVSGESHGVVSDRNQAARIACIMVADFSLAAIMRTNPELRERPFALTRTTAERRSTDRVAHGARCHPHSELSQVSAQARAVGVRPGMTVAQARALIPDLAVINPSPAAERAAADALIDVAESISPVVEEGAPGCVWLDLTGSQRFYRPSHGAQKNPQLHDAQNPQLRGAQNPQLRRAQKNPQLRGVQENPDDVYDDLIGTSATDDAHDTVDTVEEAIAAELLRRARRVGLEAAVGLAAGKEIARLAARCSGARVIEAGREREFLDWMPLDLLDLGVNARGDDLELVLKRLGIRRLGELARLDARAVGSRLGSHGAELMRLARGEDSARIAGRPRAEVFAESIELEYGIETIEPLAFVMRAMIAQLTERMQMRGLVAGDITLALGLADRRRDDRRVAVAAPTLEVRALLTLVTLNLEAAPPPAAVETIRLTIEPRTARPAQSDMFLPPAPAPDRLEAAIARIAALCGPDRVGRIAPADSYRPEAMRLGRFAPPPPTPRQAALPAATSATNNIAQMVMRTMRPAQEVEVMCMRETPEFVRGANVCARVVSAAGPWRRQGEWWAVANGDGNGAASRDGRRDSHDDAPGAAALTDASAPAVYARDYYDLALADGGVYRIYCDLNSGKWFVDGLYD
jgi:nucleotidyltransferase/DNA polymerase involved in DNA repair